MNPTEQRIDEIYASDMDPVAKLIALDLILPGAARRQRQRLKEYSVQMELWLTELELEGLIQIRRKA